jgi:Kef-type K+ transport system membrane component KefB
VGILVIRANISWPDSVFLPAAMALSSLSVIVNSARRKRLRLAV